MKGLFCSIDDGWLRYYGDWGGFYFFVARFWGECGFGFRDWFGSDMLVYLSLLLLVCDGMGCDPVIANFGM
ncbi:hypothetical protein GGS20DRAFT_563144 [Poronia punctata]|nr:hypothetical protein GGS20DRAFT_563144 [Poronia punctata]